MIQFFTDHKGWLTTMVGVASVMVAPKLGLTPEQFTTDVGAIALMVSTYVGTHNFHKAAQAKAGLVS